MCRDVNGVTSIPRRFSSESMSRSIRYRLEIRSRGTVRVLSGITTNRIATCVGGVVHGRVHGGVAGPGAMSTRLLLQFLCIMGTEVRGDAIIARPRHCVLMHRGCKRSLPLVLSTVLSDCVIENRGHASGVLRNLAESVGSNGFLTL